MWVLAHITIYKVNYKITNLSIINKYCRYLCSIRLHYAISLTCEFLVQPPNITKKEDTCIYKLGI